MKFMYFVLAGLILFPIWVMILSYLENKLIKRKKQGMNKNEQENSDN